MTTKGESSCLFGLVEVTVKEVRAGDGDGRTDGHLFMNVSSSLDIVPSVASMVTRGLKGNVDLEDARSRKAALQSVFRTNIQSGAHLPSETHWDKTDSPLYVPLYVAGTHLAPTARRASSPVAQNCVIGERVTLELRHRRSSSKKADAAGSSTLLSSLTIIGRDLAFLPPPPPLIPLTASQLNQETPDGAASTLARQAPFGAVALAEGSDGMFEVYLRYIDLRFLIGPESSILDAGKAHAARKSAFPYGLLPLDRFAEAAMVATTLNNINTSLLTNDEEKELQAKFQCKLSKAALRSFGQGSHCRRWELLLRIDLTGDVVGDLGFPAVLLVATQCRCLLSLTADRNALSLASAKRAVVALKNHPTLQAVSFRHNNFYESAGEELLRLLRTNRRIVQFTVEGNAFSEYLEKRFARQLEQNTTEQESSVFSALSPAYDYLNSLAHDTLPPATWGAIKHVWAGLCAGPASELTGMEDQLSSAASAVSVPLSGSGGMEQFQSRRSGRYNNDTSAADADAAREGDAAAIFSALDATIPALVSAPLFREVMSSVEKQFAEAYEDADIRRLFSEAGTAMIHLSLPRTVVTAKVVPAETVEAAEGEKQDAAAASTAPEEQEGSGAVTTVSVQPLSAAVMRGEENGGPAEDDEEAEAAMEYRGSFFPNSFTKMFFLPLRIACECPHRWSDGVRILRCLGAAHYYAGVRPHHYRVASQCLLKALLSNLGPTSMTDEVRAAWMQFFSLIQRIAWSGTPLMAM